MKKLIICIASLMACAYAYGQGQVNFNNRVTGDVDAIVTLNGVGVSAGWSAQLYGGPAGTAVAALTPIAPITAFRTGAAAGYVNGGVVTVPGVAAGAQAVLVLRAFNGATFESSLGTGTSNPITVSLGGGVVTPPNLTGMNAFSVTDRKSVV